MIFDPHPLPPFPHRYMNNSHGATHNSFTLEIMDAFKVDKDLGFNGSNAGEKTSKLLWHGSRLSNWSSILAQGLKIAPPEAPVTGYM